MLRAGLQEWPGAGGRTFSWRGRLAAGAGLQEMPGVEVQTFSWRRALRGGYSVFHVHWPEILVSGRSRSKKLVRQCLFVLFLLRLRLTRTPLVRTMHNLDLPDGISR